MSLPISCSPLAPVPPRLNFDGKQDFYILGFDPILRLKYVDTFGNVAIVLCLALRGHQKRSNCSWAARQHFFALFESSENR